MAEDGSILVLGIGNILWADEGFGVRAAERLDAGWRLPENVRVMDGGTQGLYLLPYLEEARVLIVLDAIDYGLEPGTIKVVRDDDVPAFLGAKKMSLHQTGFQEVLASATLMGRCPERLILIGVQPENLEDYGGGLTATVDAKVEPVVAMVRDILTGEFGVAIEPRAEGEAGTGDGTLSNAVVNRATYEGGRPGEEEACRIGDPRFLANWPA